MALELSFTYGYGRCVFKHDICGDQLEVPDCTPDSPNFLLQSALRALGAPLSRHCLKLKLQRRGSGSKSSPSSSTIEEVAEEPKSGAPVED